MYSGVSSLRTASRKLCTYMHILIVGGYKLQITICSLYSIFLIICIIPKQTNVIDPTFTLIRTHQLCKCTFTYLFQKACRFPKTNIINTKFIINMINIKNQALYIYI